MDPKHALQKKIDDLGVLFWSKSTGQLDQTWRDAYSIGGHNMWVHREVERIIGGRAQNQTEYDMGKASMNRILREGKAAN